MYDQLAHLYDWPGVLDFSEQVMERAAGVLARHGIVPPSRILDLGCGTGTLSIAMTKAGWNVIGLDISGPMLTQARRKAEQAQVSIQWIQGDMRSFALTPPAEVVFCFYDTLNHLLTPSDLEAAFHCVANALEDKGLFLFDINSRATYEDYWTGSDQWEGPNYRLTFQSRFDPETGRSKVDISADEYTDDGLAYLSDTVCEQYYCESEVRSLLEKSGFEVLEIQPFHPIEPDLEQEKPLKTFWVCRKA